MVRARIMTIRGGRQQQLSKDNNSEAVVNLWTSCMGKRIGVAEYNKEARSTAYADVPEPSDPWHLHASHFYNIHFIKLTCFN